MTEKYKIKGKGVCREVEREDLVQLLRKENPDVKGDIGEIAFRSLIGKIGQGELRNFLREKFGENVSRIGEIEVEKDGEILIDGGRDSTQTIFQYKVRLPKLSTPTFRGKNEESASDFMEDYEEYAEICNFSNKNKIDHLGMFLEGDAKKYFRNNKSAFERLWTWSAVKKAFLENFADGDFDDNFSRFYNRRQQHSESALSYIEDKIYLANKCESVISEKERVGQIVKGLIPSLKGLINLMTTRNLKELKENVKKAVHSNLDLRKGDIFHVSNSGIEQVQNVHGGSPNDRRNGVQEFDEKNRVDKFEARLTKIENSFEAMRDDQRASEGKIQANFDAIMWELRRIKGEVRLKGENSFNTSFPKN